MTISPTASSPLADLAIGKRFAFERRGRLTMKGFDEPVSLFEVGWQEPIEAEA